MRLPCILSEPDLIEGCLLEVQYAWNSGLSGLICVIFTDITGVVRPMREGFGGLVGSMMAVVEGGAQIFGGNTLFF